MRRDLQLVLSIDSAAAIFRNGIEGHEVHIPNRNTLLQLIP